MIDKFHPTGLMKGIEQDYIRSKTELVLANYYKPFKVFSSIIGQYLKNIFDRKYKSKLTNHNNRPFAFSYLINLVATNQLK